MPDVTITRLTKRFGDVAAVAGLDLTVRPGELVALLGPSGCGKTTTLRLVAGFMAPDAGEIHVGERVLSSAGFVVPPERRRMAMIFQSYALWPHMTVAQNVAYGLRFTGTPRGERGRRVEEMLRAVQLAGFGARYPGELSGGQQQRVAVARALVVEPEILLLDEPLSNLDASLREEMRFEIRRLHERFGITTLYVTHDQAEAMTIGKRVALLRGGVLQQVGAPLELYRRPADRFVASFLGSPAINLWPAVLEEGGLTVLGLRVEVEAGRLPSPGPGRAVEAGVRPEDVRVSLVPRPGVAGRVLVTEPMGNETILTMDVAGARVVARVAAEVEASPGGTVWVSLDPRRVLLFDAAGGRLLA
jgi:iron(III) transport system ATP-binding protein